ncbi:Prefoldin alpha subunit [Sistotremastrum niveocremeum HHB9708]|uniref:Prefoldin alpha subunit n=2 Tax=Sistotremastraceae TaxID=3402574 RepID=A0A164QX87_9AGAM|nr:Prefoldin alpha subunit [Sistotremastrum niveocremeum HHB9708]KZT31736.1 Prefoldin alpha subunit [Sistotremastrum suecicum HHB10207 ss-3]
MSAPQSIAVHDLELPQLADVRRQLEEELKHLTNSFAQLNQAKAKFKACIENVNEVKKENANKTILVPLTNSLYVPGKVVKPDSVIVDVGTGYYVEKTRVEALTHYRRKVEFVSQNIETLETTISKKQDNLSYVVNIMQSKLQAQQSQAGPARSGSKS